MSTELVRIEGVKTASGEKNGRSWTRFDIETSGHKYSTFDAGKGASATAFIGETVEVAYSETEKDGRTYYTLESVKRVQGEPAAQTGLTTQQIVATPAPGPSPQYTAPLSGTLTDDQKNRQILRMNVLRTAADFLKGSGTESQVILLAGKFEKAIVHGFSDAPVQGGVPPVSDDIPFAASAV